MGPILRWMDIAACLSAEKLALTCCVTLSMDHLLFDSSFPVECGATILVEAQVLRTRGAFLPPSLSPTGSPRLRYFRRSCCSRLSRSVAAAVSVQPGGARRLRRLSFLRLRVPQGRQRRGQRVSAAVPADVS